VLPISILYSSSGTGPSQREESLGLGPEDVLVVGDDGKLYEWKLDLDARSNELSLSPGMVLGLHVAVGVYDADDSWSVLGWGARAVDGQPYTYEGSSAVYAHAGDLVLATSSADLGRVTGKVIWPSGEPAARTVVRARIDGSAGTWIKAQTDGQGGFTLQLPAGAYQIEALRVGRKVVVAPGGTVHVDLDGSAAKGVMVVAGPGTAVAAGAGLSQGYWKTFGVADGAPAQGIYSMAEDQKGALWLGRPDGLTRYDGDRFVSFSAKDGLPSDVVVASWVDSRGDLWLGTDRGISRYDGKQFTNLSEEDGLVNDKVTAILEDQNGDLWFGTVAGVSRYDGEQFRNFTVAEGLPSDRVDSMLEDDEGHLWLATGHSVSRYDDGVFTSYALPDSLLKQINCIAVDGQGRLLVGLGLGSRTSGSYVGRLDGEKWHRDRAIHDGRWTATQPGLGHCAGPARRYVVRDRRGDFIESGRRSQSLRRRAIRDLLHARWPAG